MTCRVLGISRSGFYEAASRPPSARALSHRRKRGRHRPLPAPHEDLVRRRFVADAPDRLWATDVTEHPTGTGTGKVYCCAVIDAYSRMVVGWSIADHIRAELVVDAMQMATWRRRPQPGTVVHQRPRQRLHLMGLRAPPGAAGLLGSMGRVASSVDNTMVESFWSTIQRELLDTRTWASTEQLSAAIFEWIEGWSQPPAAAHQPGQPRPAAFEALHTTAATAA